MAHASSSWSAGAASNAGIALFADDAQKTPKEETDEARKNVAAKQAAYATAKKAADELLAALNSQKALEKTAQEKHNAADKLKQEALKADNAAKDTLNAAKEKLEIATAQKNSATLQRDAVDLKAVKAEVTKAENELTTAKEALAAASPDDNDYATKQEAVTAKQKALGEAQLDEIIAKATWDTLDEKVKELETAENSAKGEVEKATAAQEKTAADYAAKAEVVDNATTGTQSI